MEQSAIKSNKNTLINRLKMLLMTLLIVIYGVSFLQISICIISFFEYKFHAFGLLISSIVLITLFLFCTSVIVDWIGGEE